MMGTERKSLITRILIKYSCGVKDGTKRELRRSNEGSALKLY